MFGLALFLALPAVAQTVVNPSTAEFDPSPDHNAVVNGAPVVSRYELEISQSGQSTVLRTADLGKPVPAADGKIRVNFITLLSSPLASGVVYTAEVVAVGPGGRSASLPAVDLFSFAAAAPPPPPAAVPPACTYTVSPGTVSLAAASGGGSVAIAAESGCTWTASETSAWLTITSGASGSGNGTVTVNATANTSTTARSATLTAAGRLVTITQAGAACSYVASPATQSLAAAGGSASVTVTAGSGCTWTATDSATWLTITSGASGTGSGTVAYTAAANTSTTSRNATLTAAGQTVAITQAGAACSFVVAPTTPTIGADGGNGSVTVTTTSGCAWTASDNSGWVTIVSGASGTGTGMVSYQAAANTSASSRSAVLTVAGRTVTLTQSGAGVLPAPENLHIVAGP